MRNHFSQTGVKVVVAYIALYYFMPFILGFFYNYSYLEFYRGEPVYLWVPLFATLYLLLFFFYHNLTPVIKTPLYRVRIPFYSKSFLSVLLSFPFLVFSIKFYHQYGLSFRQSGDALSEVEGYVMVIGILKIYFTMYLLFLLAEISFGHKLRAVQVFVVFMVLMSFLFSGAASFDLIKVIVSLFIIFYYFTGRDILTRGESLGLLKIVSLLVLGFSSFFLVLFYGLSNKVGFDAAFEMLTTGKFLDILVLPIARLSVHFYSLSYHLSYNISNFDFQLQSLPNVIDNLLFRLNVLFGGDYPKPEVSSTGRLNSLQIYLSPSARNGASPGMLGSIFFMPIFPFSLLVSFAYLSFLVQKLNEIYSGERTVSLFSIFFLVTVFQAFFDAQLDMLNFVGVGGIQLVLLYLLWFDRPSLKKNNTYEE